MASKLETTISANNSKFKRALDECESKVGSFNRTIKKISATLGVAFAVAKVKSFIDELDSLGKRANDLRMSAAEFKALSHEAEHAGLSMGQFDDVMKSFAEKMGAAASGTGTEASQLAKLGVSLTDVNGKYKSTSQLLMDVADAYKNHAGGAESAKIATDLFGGSGLKMARVLEQGSEALRAQVKEFESYNAAVDQASLSNELIKDSTSTLERAFAKSFGNIVILANYAGRTIASIFGGQSYSERVMDIDTKRIQRQFKEQQALKRQAEAKALAEAEASLKELEDAEKESLGERAKEQDTIAKAQAEVQKQRLDMLLATLSEEDKILHLKQAINTQESQLNSMQAGTLEYARQELAVLKNKAKLREVEEAVADKIAKAKEESDAKEKSAQAEKIKLEEKLQSLVKARAKLIESVQAKTAQARKDTLEMVGQRAGGTAVGRHVQRAKTAQEKAQQALAEGRYSDYFRQTDKAKASMEKAEAKRKEQLTKKADEYERLGNKEGAKRMRDEIEKEGFGKNKAEKEDIEKLKEIEEHTKETKDALEKLLEGLKG